VKPARFAEGTSVPVERSRAEIEGLLKRHGAGAFFTAIDTDKGIAQFGFRLEGRMFKIEVRTPDEKDAPKAERELSTSKAAIKARTRYQSDESRKRKDAERIQKWVEGEERRRWRAQLLLVKAKLEMIATGGTTAEREFLADMVLPGGETVSDKLLPALPGMFNGVRSANLGFLLGSGK
jgi:hypothetical protein